MESKYPSHNLPQESLSVARQSLTEARANRKKLLVANTDIVIHTQETLKTSAELLARNLQLRAELLRYETDSRQST